MILLQSRGLLTAANIRLLDPGLTRQIITLTLPLRVHHLFGVHRFAGIQLKLHVSILASRLVIHRLILVLLAAAMHITVAFGALEGSSSTLSGLRHVVQMLVLVVVVFVGIVSFRMTVLLLLACRLDHFRYIVAVRSDQLFLGHELLLEYVKTII